MTNWVESHFENYPEIAKLPIVARSRFSLHLRRSGRHHIALITGAPMHFYSSASREWLPLDTSLQQTANGKLGAPGLPFILGLDGSVALDGGNHRHRTWRVGILDFPSLRGARSCEAMSSGRSNLQNCFHELHRLPSAKLHIDRLVRECGSFRHEIILLPGGLREELTLLEQPRLEPGALFVMESLLPSSSWPAGMLGEHSAGGVRFPRGWARDSNGDKIPVMRWVDESGKRLFSSVPVDWLASAAYPVVIDPDIDITGSTADGYIEGSTVTTSSTFDSSGASVNVGGRNEGGTPKVWRGYLKFNTSSLGPQSSVEQVNLRMYPNAINNYVAWTIYVRQYDWSANDPMATGTREAAWDGLAAASNAGVLATSGDPAGTFVTSADLPTSWVQLEGNTYYGLWCNQEAYSYPINQGGQHQYSSANHATPGQRPLLMIDYLGSYPLSGPVPLRSTVLAPRVSLPDTRIILRSRVRRTGLTAKVK
jgi:hypothetical protein